MISPNIIFCISNTVEWLSINCIGTAKNDIILPEEKDDS
jgi:hypothetical protein